MQGRVFRIGSDSRAHLRNFHIHGHRCSQSLTRAFINLCFVSCVHERVSEGVGVWASERMTMSESYAETPGAIDLHNDHKEPR